LIEDELFIGFPGPIEGDGRDGKDVEEEEGIDENCGEGEGEKEGEIGVAVATIENKAEHVVDKQPCGGYRLRIKIQDSIYDKQRLEPFTKKVDIERAFIIPV